MLVRNKPTQQPTQLTVANRTEAAMAAAILIEDRGQPMTAAGIARALKWDYNAMRHSLRSPENIWLETVEVEGKLQWERNLRRIPGHTKDWNKDPYWRPWVAPGDTNPPLKLGL